jgi:hypothetical protein
VKAVISRCVAMAKSTARSSRRPQLFEYRRLRLLTGFERYGLLQRWSFNTSRKENGTASCLPLSCQSC